MRNPDRHARLSRDELRRIMVEEGRAVLLEEGFGSGSQNLTFKRVFDRLEKTTGVRLTNSSVINRAWRNLADYQADVLVSIADDLERPREAGESGSIATLISALDLTTDESRARAVQTACRVSGGANSAAMASSATWPLWISLAAMATEASDPDQRRRIKAALVKGYERRYDSWNDTVSTLLELLGLRVREPWSLAQFSMAVTAYSEGCSVRNRIHERIEVIVRPTGLNGGDEEWTLFAAGLEGLVNHFLEPDPDHRPSPS